MANSLIIFTPRSGSTVVAELLAYKHNAVNLDEMMTGQIRGVLQNKLPDDVKKLLRAEQILNSDVEHLINECTYDDQKIAHVYDIYQKRFSLIKQIHREHQVVIKYFPSFSLPAVKMLEWAKNNNFEIYFLTRRSVEDQLYSYVLAHAKERFYKKVKEAGKLRMPDHAGFLNTKKTPKVNFPPVAWGKQSAISLVTIFCGINNAWTAYYNKFKDYGKLIHYEDTIGKGDFTDFGITPQLYAEYSALPTSLQPTYEYTVGDQISNWNEILDIFNEYNTK